MKPEDCLYYRQERRAQKPYNPVPVCALKVPTIEDLGKFSEEKAILLSCRCLSNDCRLQTLIIWEH